MKLNEIHVEDQEPLLLALIKQRMDKGQRVAWYVKSGDKSVPVWIHDWHQSMKTYEDGQRQVWTIRGYRGYNVEYRHIREDDMDNFSLLPGKTKNTWQLKRITSMNEGLGSDLMAYVAFADASYSDKLRPSYDKLAHDLLKRGYTFSLSPAGNAGTFKSPTNSWQKNILVRMIGKVRKRGKRKADVMVSINGHDPVTNEPWGKHQTFAIEDMTDTGADLDFILSGGDH